MKLNKWVFRAIIGVLAVVCIASAWFLTDYFIDSAKEKEKYDDLAGLVEQNKPSGGDVEIGIPEQFIDIKDPETGKTVRILKQYAQVYQLNNDLVGWISIPGTVINYPVMQTPNDPDYYLHRNFYHEEVKQGAIYACGLCDVDKPSDNITIFGHNMQDGSMFTDLMKYQMEDFWRENRLIQFDTLTEQHTYEIVSVFKTSVFGEGAITYHTVVDFASEDEFYGFVDRIKLFDFYETGVFPEYGEKLICLSTCEYTLENGRFVVLARRLS